MAEFNRDRKSRFGRREFGRARERFGRRGSDRSNRREDGRGFNRERSPENEMFEAICDRCGKTCELPFRPTGGKPVYCSSCFRHKDEFDEPRGGPSLSSGQLEQINSKLDKILKALERR